MNTLPTVWVFPLVMQSRGSLPPSEEPIIGPHPKPYLHILHVFDVILPSAPRSPMWCLPVRFTKPYRMHLSFSP